MKRPDALGIEVSIESLADADAVLHELGWIAQETARLKSLCEQKIEAIKQDFAGRQFIDIEGQQFAMSDRAADLVQRLEDWTAENKDSFLPKGKKTRDLLHGELGVRRNPLVVEIGRDENDQKYDPQSVLNWIEESSLTPSQKRALTETTVSLHLKGAKDAYTAKKITVEQLVDVGLAVREAADAPVVKPSKLIVSE